MRQNQKVWPHSDGRLYYQLFISLFAPELKSLTHAGHIPLVFCGPIPREGVVPAGGYQACNRRTLEALRRAGLIATELAYPHPKTKGFRKLLEYGRGFWGLFMAIRKVSPSVFHVTGLYKQFIYFEYAILKLAKRRGCQVIYDIRAGAMIRLYYARGPLYRQVFRKTLLLADTVMIEGQEYEQFVRRLTGKAPVYLPNYVDFDTYGREARRQVGSIPTLVFLGRIVPEKGIETVLSASTILTNCGLHHRTVVAGFGDARYLETLEKRYCSAAIEWPGALDARAALSILETAHFFLFPTRHDGEGHSNALTEAMATGCVPIASRNGFCESVIGDSGIVLDVEAPAQEYADVVRDIWVSGDWERLSRACSKRVKELFSSQSIVERLTVEYESLAEELWLK